jgi:hypothetical protein
MDPEPAMAMKLSVFRQRLRASGLSQWELGDLLVSIPTSWTPCGTTHTRAGAAQEGQSRSGHEREPAVFCHWIG